MNIKTNKIKKYISFKKSPFEKTHRCFGDKKLNKQLVNWGVENNVEHGRNLFLFNPYFNSLSTIDHLFLTPHGLILIDIIESLECIEKYDSDWWFSTTRKELIPNYFKEINRKKKELSFYLQVELSLKIPIYEIVVSKNEFLEGVYSYEKLFHQLNSIKNTNSLTQIQLEEIQNFIENIHNESIETKVGCYDSQMLLNCYCPTSNRKTYSAEYQMYKKINQFLYDNLEDVAIFQRYRIPIDGIQLPLAHYFMVSKKGGLIINQIFNGGRIKLDSHPDTWIQEHPKGVKKDSNINKIPNLIKLSRQQGQGVLHCFSSDFPVSYSIFCETPIDLQINDASLSLDVGLEHNLERYLIQNPDYLSLDQFYDLLKEIKNKKTLH